MNEEKISENRDSVSSNDRGKVEWWLRFCDCELDVIGRGISKFDDMGMVVVLKYHADVLYKLHFHKLFYTYFKERLEELEGNSDGLVELLGEVMYELRRRLSNDEIMPCTNNFMYNHFSVVSYGEFRMFYKKFERLTKGLL